MGRLRSLQVLRFAAAFGVVISHIGSPWIYRHNQFSAMGVDVFFVISGFIVTKTARARPEGFLANRAARVLPPYFAWVAPWLASGSAGHWLRPLVLLSSLTLWPAWGSALAWPALKPGWSLCFEALFYVCLWLTLRGVRWQLLILAYAVAIALAYATGAPIFRYLGSPLILEVLAGAALTALAAPRPILGLSALALAAAEIAAFALFGYPELETRLTIEPGAWARPLLWGAPAGLLVFGAMQLEPWLGGRWTSPLVFLGDASYSLYLSHPLVLVVLAGIAPDWNPWLKGAICVVVGALAYRGLEKPLIRIARDLIVRTGLTVSPLTTWSLGRSPKHRPKPTV